ncbi:MAG: Uma2 family endonuclease [Limnothrix sp. BL-A-16]|jgi:Uma2 family endonuclease
MVATIASGLSLAEFLQQPDIDDSPAWEFHDQGPIQKPMPGGKHSRLQIRLGGAINAIDSPWEALTEMRCTFGGRSIVPDLIVVRETDVPIDEAGEISDFGMTVAPNWAIEILSPAQGETRVVRNLLHCLRHGGQLGWLVMPRDRVVVVFLPDALPLELSGSDRLPVLPELTLALTVDELFSWLKRRES